MTEDEALVATIVVVGIGMMIAFAVYQKGIREGWWDEDSFRNL